ncbi:doubled CXXCH domain-containing protein [Maridesulfovibrio ferrireducens]|uniref:Doubled CXXCH domain-containing protein n=1 Tax=Maridesulfovibrio ferrireducens TaxID=246191 RepID=A0A1G9HSS9_9BACT|nr:cytochrome c3 family protein [Maridesulfovibrio ferrireducens]SDL15892.1 doubled CXXCH domain-containing protein [Maridesulfovibrio ferrireducens]
MHKKFLPISIILILLLGLAVAGYMTPPEKQKVPVRILFKNSGGKVIFTHIKHHRDYEIPCDKCHHEREGQSNEPLPCGSCHPQTFDRDYVRDHINSFPDKTYCVKCHHAELGQLNFDHEAHEEYAEENCLACHHGPEIEEEPQKCSNCHSNAGTKEVPSVRDAAHDRCVTCHEDQFKDGLKGCNPCHKMKNMKQYKGDSTPCEQCHQKAGKDLVLDRLNAFHDQCMVCHKELKKGPYKDNDCDKCHLR